MTGRLILFCYFLCLSVCIYAQNRAVTITERYRPEFHFTPPAHWMNDPNGMVFFEGEWHLFYQHHPYSTVWGPMHWGHAVSHDLVNWEHLPVALYPDSLGLIFSGSAVVDWENTSGFGQDGKPPLVAIFTQHLMAGEKAGRHDFQYQSIAYSNDKGRTWTKYADNPVIPNTNNIHDFRDPKVIRDEVSKQWIMVFAAHDHVKFWSSPNLKDWQHLSDFGKESGAHGGVWECPDIFPISVEGTDEKRWILLLSINPGSPNGGSGTQYFIGDFDGKTFKLDPDFEKLVADGQGVWLDFGRDNYAGVTFSDVPKSDGRRIFMGWMSNWDYATVVPTEKWRSAMTLPRKLVLRKTEAGLRLFAQPVKELESLRRKEYILEKQKMEGDMDLTKKWGFSPATFEIQLEVELPRGKKSDFAVVLSNAKNEEYRIGFDAAKNEFYSDRTRAGEIGFSGKFASKRHTAPRVKEGNILQLHLFFDMASCELFADGGETVMTDIFFPTEDFGTVKLVSNTGGVKIKKGKIFELKF